MQTITEVASMVMLASYGSVLKTSGFSTG